jgi:hypothetical protein
LWCRTKARGSILRPEPCEDLILDGEGRELRDVTGQAERIASYLEERDLLRSELPSAMATLRMARRRVVFWPGSTSKRNMRAPS